MTSKPKLTIVPPSLPKQGMTFPITEAREAGTYPLRPTIDPMPYKGNILEAHKSPTFWTALNWTSAKARKAFSPI